MNPFRILFQLLGKSKPPSFEDLMCAVAEDDKYRKVVLWICKQNEFQRRSILRTQLEIMELKRAPSELRILFQSLEDDHFAEKAIEYLTKEGA